MPQSSYAGSSLIRTTRSLPGSQLFAFRDETAWNVRGAYSLIFREDRLRLYSCVALRLSFTLLTPNLGPVMVAFVQSLKVSYQPQRALHRRRDCLNY